MGGTGQWHHAHGIGLGDPQQGERGVASIGAERAGLQILAAQQAVDVFEPPPAEGEADADAPACRS
jgi:hypothetical protein